MPIPMTEPIPLPTVDCPVCGAVATVLRGVLAEHAAAPDAPNTWLRPGEPCPASHAFGKILYSPAPWFRLENSDEAPALLDAKQWAHLFEMSDGDEWRPDGCHRGLALLKYRAKLDASNPLAKMRFGAYWPVWYDRTGIDI